jgi:hypothetical protein
MKFSKILLLGMAFVFASSISAQSQLTTGAISGTVQDANGALVIGAKVTVLNEETNQTRNIVTNDDGLFVAPVLPVGNYMVTIEKEGFARIEQKNLKVNVGRTTTLRPVLQTGEVTAIVTVESTPIIDTVKTDESTLISRTQINELPINGRRADQFALLAPGVTRDGRFGLLSYRGQSGVFNNFTLEGNDDNQAYFAEAAGRTRIASNISANAIQEFQVATSNFLPEFGRSAGGGINAVVRSGGNEFHGDGFWYFRNQDFSARDPLASINPDERRDQFGGSVSGPIIKDKLFFFTNYDQQIRNFPLVTEDLSGVLTTGLPANPSAADQTAFARGTADLRSRFPGGAPGNTLPREFNQNLFLVKFDYLLNNANTFSLTYNYLNARNPNGIQTPLVLGNVGRNGSDDVRINTGSLRLTTIITPKVVNEFRFQIKRDFEYQFGNEPPPQVFVGGFSYGRANFLERPALPDERRYQFVDNVSFNVGNHSIKVGGDINYVRDKISNPSNFGATYNYSNALTYGRDLIARDGGVTARNYTSYTQSFGIESLTFSTTDYAFFIQDQWRIRKNVTINYGLRYDLQRLPEPIAPNPDVPETTVINQANSNFGPRIGVAWDIFGDQKNLVRGGYGIYYGRTPNGTIFNALTQTGLRDANGLPDLTRTVASISINPTTAGAPVFPNILTSFPTNLATSTNVFRLDQNFENPRLQEINIGYERQIFNNLSVSASFIYTKGERLPVNFDTNLPQPAFTRNYLLPDGTSFTVPFAAGVTCTIAPANGVCPTANRVNVNASRPNPNFGSLNQLRSIGETYYRALFVEVKRRFAQGFQFNIAYTLAKAENLSGTGGGDGSGSESPFGGSSLFNQFDNNSNRAAAPTDQRHRFVFNGIWQLPKFEGSNKFARALLNGYQLSGIFTGESGRPYSANISIPTISFTQNGQIFTPFGGGTLGLGGLSLAPNIERNSIYGDVNYKVDLRLSRKFNITEKVQVELIGEGFNIFNRSNFNGFNTTLYNTVTPSPNPPTSDTPIQFIQNSSFGVANNDGSQPDGTNARRFQLAARFRF